ncbi:Uncharacterized protein dnm_038820 [Desulfonema magnum]|uniref:Uncharacterized protein n=1 Tax=Desulfonema magnum TaxID=45655 RepID=A0A975BLU9_9BACT|nr:Uncharacterized protein dnm_038820 [Desulfonema magnum]
MKLRAFATSWQKNGCVPPFTHKTCPCVKGRTHPKKSLNPCQSVSICGSKDGGGTVS